MIPHVEFHLAQVAHIFQAIAVAAVLIVSASCTTTSSGDSSADYTPRFTPIKAGFRPVLPLYSSEVTYSRCEYFSESELTDIRRNFVRPLLEGDYQLHIVAIVVHGSYETVQTRFSIWLHDGRHLDSGLLFFGADDSIAPEFSEANLGSLMFNCAERMLRKAIPDAKLRRDRQSLGLASQ
jgi:hypothetical protein